MPPSLSRKRCLRSWRLWSAPKRLAKAAIASSSFATARSSQIRLAARS